MKKIICLFASAFLLNSGVGFAQGIIDAYRYSQTDLNGTARYLSMGGAFGALGGDISALSANPAGLGIYRSSEIVGTLSLSAIRAKTNWVNAIEADKTRLNFSNIAYVGYFPTGNDEGLISWNVGFAYNRVKNYERNYRMEGKQNYSLGDYAAAVATYAQYDHKTGVPEDAFVPLLSGTESERRQAYNQMGGLWLPALAYQGGLIGANEQGGNIYHSAFAETDEKNGGWFSDSRPDEVSLDVSERGAIDKYDFSFATNIANRLFLGATISVTDLRYRMVSEYTEKYHYTDSSVDHLYWDNQKTTDGTGYGLNIGAIARPSDFLRIGVAYNSPTWYTMTDRYHGSAETNIAAYNPPTMKGETPTDPDPYTEYRFRSPDKWIFSIAGFIGQTALISVDYELKNYKTMFLSSRDGYAYPDNDGIKSHFTSANTIKAGAEVKITPQFAVRAGMNWQDSPMKADFKNGNIEVFPAGTVAHYTLDKGMTAYSCGLGYRFTPNFYTDLSCVFRTYKEDAYTFSKVIVDGQAIVGSEAIPLKTNTTQVSLTFGYKF